MPFVKWRRGMDEDITNEMDLPVGKSVLSLTDIRVSANYTCIASSSLGVIEALAMVKVQCKFAESSLPLLQFLIGNFLALPIAPTDLRISEVTATTVRLEWSYKGPEDLQYYVLQHKPKNANQVREARACATLFIATEFLLFY